MRVIWDQIGERTYETGLDRGMLYPPAVAGVPWNGLTNVSENPSGAEASPLYADNIKYLNLISAEDFGATVEAYTYPDEFGECDGSAVVAKGVKVGQQKRSIFGMSYRTIIGNDVDSNDHGYKIHFVYQAQAAPSSKAYNSVNDSPEAITFSWELTTTPVPVPGYKPSATLIVDSRTSDPAKLAELEDILYGKDPTTEGGNDGVEPRLPLPSEIITLMGEVTP